MSSASKDASPSDAPLQFDAVVPAAGSTPAASAMPCVLCKKPIAGQYYEANGKTVCVECKQRVEARANSDGGSLGKSLLLGTGAAVLGAAIYYAVLATTNINFGLISVLVGYMVGKAVRKGSNGFGGPKYQAVALGLTYLAVGATYVPFMFRDTRPTVLAVIIGLVIGPVLVLTKDIISGVISAFALFEAWQLTRRARIAFTGPYTVGAPRTGSATA